MPVVAYMGYCRNEESDMCDESVGLCKIGTEHVRYMARRIPFVGVVC